MKRTRIYIKIRVKSMMNKRIIITSRVINIEKNKNKHFIKKKK